MVRSSVRLFRIAGIDIGVHVSWLIIFGLTTWSIATGVLPQVLPGIQPVEAWLIGAVSAILLFASVLVHELAHSLVAIRRGIAVHSITLFLFGGVSNLTGESKDPRTEFLIAIVGPLSSFVIAGIAYLLAIAIPDRSRRLRVRLPGDRQCPARRVQPHPRIPARRRAGLPLDHLEGDGQRPPCH